MGKFIAKVTGVMFTAATELEVTVAGMAELELMEEELNLLSYLVLG